MRPYIESCQEAGIDLGQYIEVIAKRKKTFFAVFLFVFALGFAHIQFSPKI